MYNICVYIYIYAPIICLYVCMYIYIYIYIYIYYIKNRSRRSSVELYFWLKSYKAQRLRVRVSNPGSSCLVTEVDTTNNK